MVYLNNLRVFYCYLIINDQNSITFWMKIATEKEFADIKITTVNLSTEIKSKFYELNIERNW